MVVELYGILASFRFFVDLCFDLEVLDENDPNDCEWSLEIKRYSQEGECWDCEVLIDREGEVNEEIHLFRSQKLEEFRIRIKDLDNEVSVGVVLSLELLREDWNEE